MSEKSIFSRIIDREVPAEFIYEDDQMVVIKDIKKDAPIHCLAIPKHPYANIHELVAAGEQELLWKMVKKLTEIAEGESIHQSGYRLITNNGPDAHQVVPHLHIHLVGGEELHMCDPLPEA
jgi:histidine triad (HIT) family protein